MYMQIKEMVNIFHYVTNCWMSSAWKKNEIWVLHFQAWKWKGFVSSGYLKMYCQPLHKYCSPESFTNYVLLLLIPYYSGFKNNKAPIHIAVPYILHLKSTRVCCYRTCYSTRCCSWKTRERRNLCWFAQYIRSYPFPSWKGSY